MSAPGRPGSALVIGEALVDVVIHPGQEPVDIPGGSPANVALGLARLGRDAELHCWIGTDERGKAVRAHLEASGVRLAAGADGAERTEPVPAWRARALVPVGYDDEVEEALAAMQRSGAHLGHVRNTQGRFVGVLFLEDILEELVGEVNDAMQREEHQRRD